MHWKKHAHDKKSNAMHWDCIAYDKQVVLCFGIVLLMISIVCAMHRDCIAYDKHSCAMQWD